MQSGPKTRACRRQRPPARIANLAAGAALAALVACGTFLIAQSPAAQGPAPESIRTPAQPALPAPRTAPTHKLAAQKPSPSTLAPAAAQTPAPEPPKPDWPVNDQPAPAKVTWDTHGLTVEANNSSLGEILKEVATQTGAKLSGKAGDERVFGFYGPGPARDIIKQLLDGTACNVLMFGDQGEGTPREIVLSNRPTGPAPANNGQINSDEDVENEPPQQPVQGIPAIHNAFGPQGMPPEQNQQLMEQRRAEMEQRQEQMRQQQQQQAPQQQNPPQ